MRTYSRFDYQRALNAFLNHFELTPEMAHVLFIDEVGSMLIDGQVGVANLVIYVDPPQTQNMPPKFQALLEVMTGTSKEVPNLGAISELVQVVGDNYEVTVRILNPDKRDMAKPELRGLHIRSITNESILRSVLTEAIQGRVNVEMANYYINKTNADYATHELTIEHNPKLKALATTILTLQQNGMLNLEHIRADALLDPLVLLVEAT